MSQLILRRIDKMQTLAANYYRTGRLIEWFFEWKNLKFQIIGKLEDDEKKELTRLENEINKYKTKNEDGDIILIEKGVPFVEEYVELLQTYIEEKEIGLVGKGDETTFT